MKRLVTVIVLVTFVLNCAPALPNTDYSQIEKEYPIIISEQVSEDIDADERAQFGLFTGIDGYKNARFYAIRGGGYLVEIVTETQRLVSINADKDAVIILFGYIKNYKLKEADPIAFADWWGIVDYDTLGLPITKSQVNRTGVSRATSCGCVGGILAVVAFAAIITVQAGSGEGDPALNALGILLAIPMAAILGLVTGCLSGTASFFGEKKTAVDKIKEQRKLIVIE